MAGISYKTVFVLICCTSYNYKGMTYNKWYKKTKIQFNNGVNVNQFIAEKVEL